MTITTDKFAVTTDFGAYPDVIDDTLSSLRIGGSLLLREAYAPPWAIEIPSAGQLAKLLGVNSEANVVAFHLVEFRHCEISPEDGDSFLLRAGEMAIFFGGQAHRLSQGKPARTQSIAALLAGSQNTHQPDVVGQPSTVSLLCGVFMLHNTVLNPLLTALPPVIRASLSKTGALHNLSGAARLMTDELDRKSLGGRYVVERLLEVLCAEAVRAHIETTPHQGTNWFRGVRDPVVGTAIAAIHQHPGTDWSVKRLAQEVAMSPSRFAARFSEALGDSPMAYVAKWRMNVACRQLAASQQGIGQIASNVGYDSLAAFSRAFKKHVGLPPAAWRAQEK